MIFGRSKSNDDNPNGDNPNDDNADAQEWEGWWEPTPSSPCPELHGKIEWEPSLDGGTEVDLLVGRGLELPDGTTVDVVCDGEIVVSATVEKGETRKILKSSDGHRIPNLARRRVELRHGDTVLAETVLEPD